MPKSKTRKKKATSATSGAGAAQQPQKLQVSPPWLVPTMLTLVIVGLAWVLVTSLTSGNWPISAIGYWNLAVGFAFVAAGGVLSTRWY